MLDGKTAIVTGGASGIGRGIALVLADRGAEVIVADVRAEPRQGGSTTVERIQAETESSATFVECDVANPDDIDTVVTAAAENDGLDLMVNNAAIARGLDADVTEAEFDRMLDVNVKGVFYGTKIAGERISESGGGAIVNVASTEGVRGVSPRPVYSGTRGAIPLMSASFAGYFGPEGVRVNTIHPGLVDTAMVREDIPILGSPAEEEIVDRIALGRPGTNEEIGDVVAFLGSDLASYVTGAELLVDGGYTTTQG